MNANPKTSDRERTYKRSWKNLLINKRYQLRFTLFMVGMSALLMIGLGIWVMRVANETTTVSMASVRGEPCPKIPALGNVADEDAGPAVPMALPDPGAPAAPAAPAAEAPADEEHHAKVVIDESSMTLTATLPPDYVESIAKHWRCELVQVGKLASLERGRTHILWALVGTGLLLAAGLALYGIKMTHKVAGPLFKVGLYMDKMKNGRFDKVYNLRKGDQLVEFYDHFRTAHAGVVAAERSDVAALEAVVAAARDAGLGDDADVKVLAAIAARKGASVE